MSSVALAHFPAIYLRFGGGGGGGGRIAYCRLRAPSPRRRRRRRMHDLFCWRPAAEFNLHTSIGVIAALVRTTTDIYILVSVD